MKPISIVALRNLVSIPQATARLIWVMAFSILAQNGSAQTQTVTLNLSTAIAGQSGQTFIPIYQHDDDWYITSDTVIKAPPARLAWVVDPNTTNHIKWALTLPNTGWISGASDRYFQKLPAPPTSFTYRTCFTLPAAECQASVALNMRADDIIRQVRLNGMILYNDVSTGNQAKAGPSKAGSFLGPKLSVTDNPVAYPHNFKAGQNCIEIDVADEQQMVSGLNVEGTAKYQDLPSMTCQQSGQVIERDISTGVTWGGFTKLAAGSVDPKWKLVAVPTGNPGSAYVVGGNIVPWLTPPASAGWLQRSNNWKQNIYEDAGKFVYRMILGFMSPTAQYSNMEITMRYAADNSAVVRLNGVQVDSCAGPNCFSSWRPTLILHPSALGMLEVEVTNLAVAPGTPSGLIVDGKLKLTCK